ncbi:MAG: LacI family transcriptional regulator [Akkermansiaceae bacterium]|jgi:DNA-binding LacI/PurR family transcriptional regulator|nr:LacI family transcriptional regulator [Akkermansiaceae bacterium]
MSTEPGSPRISLRDIAAKLGVSHSTVSLALRDHPRISESVRARVKAAAEEFGYRPDPMLAALANYRRGKVATPISSSVAWINGWPKADQLRGYKEFDQYWNGAFKAAEKFGYRLEEFRIGRECTAKRLHQILSTRGIRGILLPPHREAPAWGDFPWDQYSVVRFGRSVIKPEVHVVTADQIANTMLAVQSMHALGYRRIGFTGIAGDFTRRGLLFQLGFAGGQRLIQDPQPIPPLALSDDRPAERSRQLKSWLKEHQPDAILTTDATLGEMLEKCGLHVPDDIGLAVTSILDAKADAGIDQHPEEIGRVGFLMLNSLMNDRAKGIPPIFRQILVEGSWVNGQSLPHRT